MPTAPTLPTIFVSPAEPAGILRGLGPLSRKTESYGVDFMWHTRGQWFGAQRKELKDFLASVTDGRLAKELMQMRGRIAMPLVIIEGRPVWTTEGVLAGQWAGEWTAEKVFNISMSVRHEGAQLMMTDSQRETTDVLKAYAKWSMKEHMSLLRRGGAIPTSAWGDISNRDYGLWFLQGLPDVGPKLAAAILDHFGRVPFAWEVDEKQLMQVRGIGRERARQLIATFAPTDSRASIRAGQRP